MKSHPEPGIVIGISRVEVFVKNPSSPGKKLWPIFEEAAVLPFGWYRVGCLRIGGVLCEAASCDVFGRGVCVCECVFLYR